MGIKKQLFGPRVENQETQEDKVLADEEGMEDQVAMVVKVGINGQ